MTTGSTLVATTIVMAFLMTPTARAQDDNLVAPREGGIYDFKKHQPTESSLTEKQAGGAGNKGTAARDPLAGNEIPDMAIGGPSYTPYTPPRTQKTPSKTSSARKSSQ